MLEKRDFLVGDWLSVLLTSILNRLNLTDNSTRRVDH